MDENLAWLTQKTEEPKCNKGNFTPSPPFNKGGGGGGSNYDYNLRENVFTGIFY